jgi:tRNA(fMet)-specific endonuclease VapC
VGRRARPRAVPSGAGGAALDRLILDTTVLISAERTGSALDAVIADEDDVAIAAVTAAELLVGVELATARHRERRRQFVEAVLGTIPVEGYDLAVARAHARLLAAVRRTGRPRGAHDLIVAATAVSTDREVLTTDASGFAGLPGVQVRSLS